MQDDGLPERTRPGRPASTSTSSAPRDNAPGDRDVIERLDASDDAGGEGAFARDEAMSRPTPCAALDFTRDRHVCFIGKLIVSKGIDLLLAAWPLVPEARLVIVGFGGFRDGLLELLDALAEGYRDAVRAIAQAGRELEGGPRAPLRHLLAFLETADDGYGPRRATARARRPHGARTRRARAAPGRLRGSLPSTFPEAYGMVAAEAAACGVLPVSAGHSGAKEVSAMLAAAPGRANMGCRSRSTTTCGAGRSPRACAWLEAPDDLRARRRWLVGHGARALLVDGVAAESSRRPRDGWWSCPPVA